MIECDWRVYVYRMASNGEAGKVGRKQTTKT